MSQKKRIGVIFGGRSGEHEVSVMSAASVIRELDRNKFDVTPIGITKGGRWLLVDDFDEVVRGGHVGDGSGTEITRLDRIDVVFPVVHGPYGEDGTIQGFLEILDIPYVGAGVLASAVGMDKSIMKAVFAQAGLPTVRHKTVLVAEYVKDPDRIIREIESELGYPCFVKPCNLGSSVGISKAKERDALIAGIKEASVYDRKLVVEEGVIAREIECSVLGNDEPQASLPGEIVPCREFYDYRAKYLEEGSRLLIPAPLEPGIREEIRRLAVEAFKAIDCSGMARVDFFVTSDGRVMVNEINTIPGFTRISMFPKLWEASGLSYSELLSTLVELALDRYHKKRRLKTSYEPG